MNKLHFFFKDTLLLAKLRPDFRDLYVNLDIENDTLVHVIRLRIKSMSATSGPPIGPVLGQYAIPISKFCSEFNERTTYLNEGVDVFVTLFHYANGSYSFDISTPVSSMCFKRAAGITRGFGKKLKMGSGFITPYMIFESVIYKAIRGGGVHNNTLYNIVSKGVGTVRSLGMNITNVTFDNTNAS